MDLLAGRAMDLGFRLTQCLEDRNRGARRPRRQSGPLDHRANLMQMPLGLRCGHLDLEFYRRDPAHRLAPRREPIAADREPRHGAFERREVGARVDQRADDHIAAQSRESIEIRGLHVLHLYITGGRH